MALAALIVARRFHTTRAAVRSLRHMLGLVGGRRVGERRRKRRSGPASQRVRAKRTPATVFLTDRTPFNTPFAGLAAMLQRATS